MATLSRAQFKSFLASLQAAVYELVKSQVPDGDETGDAAGAIVFPHLVAEIDREDIEAWRGTFANAFGRIHSYVIGWGGIRKRDLQRTAVGTIQPIIRITIEGYMGYSHAAQSDFIFRDEVNGIYLELETNRKLNLPADLQKYLLKVENVEFTHMLIPVGGSDKVHTAFGEIVVELQPIQISD